MNEKKSEDRRSLPRRGGFRGGPHAMGMPVEKPKDFKGTLKRLLGYIKPFKLQLTVVFITAILSNVFGILSPKIMGKAITKLFEGLMMKLSGVPGAQVDFAYIGQILLLLGGLYTISAAFSYINQIIMVNVAQKTVYTMRKDINHKLSRLPLKFFDSRTHGEILSRVTNDVDTVSGTLQQSISQIITAAVTLVGVLIMMLSISPVMTLVSVATLPAYALATRSIARRSQKYFAAQQKALGELNGHVEEMYGGHVIIKAFGRERQSVEQFKKLNQELYNAGWKAQFISGVIMPLMNFFSNIGYVLVCV